MDHRVDVYGVAPLTVMNIYQVGANEHGRGGPGRGNPYAVLYSNTKLNVINTGS